VRSNLARLVEAEGQGGGNVCFMLYQVADTTNLETDIINDFLELIGAPGIKDPTLMTWVYHDGKQGNHCLLATLLLFSSQHIHLQTFFSTLCYSFAGRENSGAVGVQTTPIKNIWTSDGSQRISDLSDTKFTGSRYFHYNHKLDKMLQVVKLDEQNSDDPNVIFRFFSHAMTDCIKKGSKEFFVAFSSHGTGYAGFGGDSNKGRRRLVGTNAGIAAALQRVLKEVEGAPATYDVIGFDACT